MTEKFDDTTPVQGVRDDAATLANLALSLDAHIHTSKAILRRLLRQLEAISLRHSMTDERFSGLLTDLSMHARELGELGHHAAQKLVEARDNRKRPP